MSDNFSTGLFDCMSDMPICCIGMYMAPCLVGDNYSRVAGEGGCGKCCCYTVLSQCFLCALVGGPVRKSVRDKYGLAAGNGDCCLHCFCAPCAVCQETREIKIRQAGNIVGSPITAPLQQSGPKY